MRSLRAWLRVARLLALLLVGLALASFVSLLERLPGDRMPLRQRLTRWYLARLSGALPFELRVHGELPGQPMLWVSNHVSWVDIPLLGGLLPLTFLSKAEVRQWPVAGWLAEKAGTLFIRRGSGDSRMINAQLATHLSRGRSLLVFPEGTTTDGQGLRTFHGRLMASAIEAGVPVQPVALRYRRNGQACELAPFIGDDDLVSHLKRLFAHDRGIVEIHLLPVLSSAHQDRNLLARQAHAAIHAVVCEVQEAPAIAA
ncbi:1-acyl-sn-glycerol-3-phosphate acyltransferase [Pseudomonas nicosulfuronedens]|uniref:1-acyl-sn-glycerol-3-phosphate acyltransferase n=1 Tax=Pseudomonas nicosulfuronedens TaxID=2571105 RepID=A0A5R9R742_9PSED|nr:lysophospholipid acyltransferase family protein [Pseudomonas nicosulfuronedens]MDH1009687.1 1-acyl-sn-glycerol-3-phosphate acyltransferase [Pseudomonas nicosulfuronedens]MDH1980986.1 1-acyl-sn-glycerol-3-phosphate acyltransferase [Pseudomonas nicosulfuronedens]MDH2027753.1 1-acyl-sn-glycerol-3-phosphate acyltransferase [Pseudomonas nicosulfuronedens]TLX78657.1 1-acyl-sn-glycerol-3-phosphate acyltransferase [Pseudomonas nicosulfuronedens]